MKNKIVPIIVIIVCILFSPFAYHFYWMARGYLQPDMVEQGRERYRGLTSEYLIKKLHSISPYDVYTALDVLAERKEKKAVPDIIGFLKSSYRYKRDSGIRALAKINDQRAIEPLMVIIKKGRNHPDYNSVLLALSQLKYEGAYPYVLELAKEHNSYSIVMLKEYAKIETIPLLEAIKEGIKGNDLAYIIERNQIEEVIAYIKENHEIK